jgi:hypothetical protein
MSQIATVLVIEHSPGISLEGAIKQRNDADAAIAALGLEVVGARTFEGDAQGIGMSLVWRDET